MKREFRLNDRSSCREPSGQLVTLFTYVKFSQSGGKTSQVRSKPSRSFKRQYFIMNSSMDEVKEKETAFLQGNVYNVHFSENYCFAVHEGDVESLSDLIHKYLSVNFNLIHSNINNTGRE